MLDKHKHIEFFFDRKYFPLFAILEGRDFVQGSLYHRNIVACCYYFSDLAAEYMSEAAKNQLEMLLAWANGNDSVDLTIANLPHDTSRILTPLQHAEVYSQMCVNNSIKVANLAAADSTIPLILASIADSAAKSVYWGIASQNRSTKYSKHKTQVRVLEIINERFPLATCFR